MSPDGEFTRDQRYIATRITADGRDGYPVEPGRYRLVVSRACPWANRAIIVRRLLGLEDVLSMGVAGPTHDERSWTFDLDPGGRDPVLGIERLQEAYFARFPGYDRGITVPAIVDVTDRAGGDQRLRPDHPRPVHRSGGPTTGPARRDLYPEPLRAEIDEVNAVVFADVNNGVYRCGFAGTQEAYDGRVPRGSSTGSTGCRERLAGQRYLVGDTITEADVRLFTTLVRFDAVYHGHFKCNRQKLTEMPVLWAYARDLFQTPGFGDTVDFVHIKRHYYEVHRDINPTGHRAARPGPVRVAGAARPGGARRPAVRGRHSPAPAASGARSSRPATPRFPIPVPPDGSDGVGAAHRHHRRVIRRDSCPHSCDPCPLVSQTA